MKFAKEIDVKHFSEMFLDPHQIFESKENSFWVYSNKNGDLKLQGILLRPNSPTQTRFFYFVSTKSFRKYLQRLQITMSNIINGLDFRGKENVFDLINNFK